MFLLAIWLQKSKQHYLTDETISAVISSSVLVSLFTTNLIEILDVSVWLDTAFHTRSLYLIWIHAARQCRCCWRLLFISALFLYLQFFLFVGSESWQFCALIKEAGSEVVRQTLHGWLKLGGYDKKQKKNLFFSCQSGGKGVTLRLRWGSASLGVWIHCNGLCQPTCYGLLWHWGYRVLLSWSM